MKIESKSTSRHRFDYEFDAFGVILLYISCTQVEQYKGQQLYINFHPKILAIIEILGRIMGDCYGRFLELFFTFQNT